MILGFRCNRSDSVVAIFGWECGLTTYLAPTTATTINIDLTFWGNTILFTGSTNSVLNLPAISSTPIGYTITIKNSSASANVTITPNGSDQIEGGSTYICIPNTSYTMASDGSQWRLIILSSALVLPLAVDQGGTGQSAYTDGELLIGNTSTGSLSVATLTAGSGISVTNGHGTITVANTSISTPSGSAGALPYYSGTSAISPSSPIPSNAIVVGSSSGTGAPTADSDFTINSHLLQANLNASLPTAITGTVIQVGQGSRPELKLIHFSMEIPLPEPSPFAQARDQEGHLRRFRAEMKSA